MDVHHHLATGHGLKLVLDRLDLRAALANHDAGARRPDREANHVPHALDLDAGDGSPLPLLHDPVMKPEVLMELCSVLLAPRVPFGLPVRGDTKPVSYGMNLLSHE